MPPPGSKSPSEVLRDPETKNGQLYRELFYLTVRIYCRLVSSFIKKNCERGLNKLWSLCPIPMWKFTIKYVQTKSLCTDFSICQNK